MSIDFSFRPDPARAAELNRRMHVSLGDSLRHISTRAQGVCRFDEAALATLIKRLHSGDTFGAETFAAYYALVPALLTGDEVAASAAFMTLASARPAPAGLRLVPLTTEDLGSRFGTYVRLMNGDESLAVGMRSPSLDIAARFRERFRRALALLDQAVPEVAGEVRHLINELIIVVGDPTTRYQF